MGKSTLSFGGTGWSSHLHFVIYSASVAQNTKRIVHKSHLTQIYYCYRLENISRSVEKQSFQSLSKPPVQLLPLGAIHRFSGKSNSKSQRAYEGMDEGRLAGKMKKGNEWKREREQTWLEDVWRFLCCRINSSLFICSAPPPLPPLTPGHWQDTETPDAYAGKAQHRLPRTHLISLALPLTSHLSPSLPPTSLSLIAHGCLSPRFFPCSSPSMLFSPNSYISHVSHIAVISVSSLSFPSSVMLCCFCSVPSFTLSVSFFLSSSYSRTITLVPSSFSPSYQLSSFPAFIFTVQ